MDEVDAERDLVTNVPSAIHLLQGHSVSLLEVKEVVCEFGATPAVTAASS